MGQGRGHRGETGQMIRMSKSWLLQNISLHWLPFPATGSRLFSVARVSIDCIYLKRVYFKTNVKLAKQDFPAGGGKKKTDTYA